MGHMRFSASAAHRWMACTASLEFIEQLRKEGKIPKRSYSVHADKGTAVHWMIEQVLLEKEKDINAFLGKEVFAEGMEKPLVMTSKELRGAKLALDYVDELRDKAPKNRLYAEKKYDLSPVFGAPLGGTTDITFIVKGDFLDIIDYKNGRIVVEVENNPQLRIYALGAYYRFHKRFRFTKIKMTVIQPNAFHPGGDIRSETVTVTELLDWGRELAEAVDNIQRGKTSFVANEDHQCLWCEAKPFCQAYKETKYKVQPDPMSMFVPLTDVHSLPEPEELTSEQWENILKNADHIMKFYKKCKEFALQKLEDDPECIQGFELVPKLGNRTLTKDKDTLEKALKDFGVKPEDLIVTETKQRTITQLEGYLKEKNIEDYKEFLETVCERPQRGFALTEVCSAQQDFKDLLDNRNTENGD